MKIRQVFVTTCFVVGLVLIGWGSVLRLTEPTQPVRSLGRVELPAGDLVVVVRPATHGRAGEVALWYAAYDAPKVRTLISIPGAPAVPPKPVWPGELMARGSTMVLDDKIAMLAAANCAGGERSASGCIRTMILWRKVCSQV